MNKTSRITNEAIIATTENSGMTAYPVVEGMKENFPTILAAYIKLATSRITVKEPIILFPYIFQIFLNK
jgi:hypothetical protein